VNACWSVPPKSVQKLAAYQAAGAQRIFLWPVVDELRQLAMFWERVAAAVST